MGGGGEPVDLRRTFLSHGIADLPPMWIADDASRFEITLPVRGARPRTVLIEAGRKGRALATVSGRVPSRKTMAEVERGVRHVLRLDEDLSGFYGSTASDEDLSWIGTGAGRMIQSPTVFEEVVKTVCTTNCSWSATVRMVSALVEHLGEPAVDAPADGWKGRAFPTPVAMADADETFYRETVRAGYRGPYFRSLAASVAAREIDLEAWGNATVDDLPDAELSKLLQGLPGVGPYAAAHIMMMMGRYSSLILDSWTRPTYARLVGKRSVKDSAIEKRFARYGPYAGLAFWLFLTKDWIDD